MMTTVVKNEMNTIIFCLREEHRLLRNHMHTKLRLRILSFAHVYRHFSLWKTFSKTAPTLK